MACFKDQQKAFNQILRSAKAKYEQVKTKKQLIHSWVNQRTFKDHFSALHYASYRGNTDMCQTLLDLGADLLVTN